jgi:hypothetical protein
MHLPKLSLTCLFLTSALAAAPMVASSAVTAASSGDTTYQFVVLPKPSSTTYSPRKIVEAINTPVKVRTPEQAALAMSLGEPASAETVINRAPTDYEVEMIGSATDVAYSKIAQQFGYVTLTYNAPQDAAARTQATESTDARLQSVGEFLSTEKAQSGAFAALPTEASGYLGTGTPPFDTVNTQWGMHAMRFPQAWEKVKGHAYVSVLDSGIDIGHPDLDSNVRTQFSRNFNGSSNINDSLGHGTHVAGIIAAVHNNQANSVAGGCANCSLGIFATGPGIGAVNLGLAHAADFGAQVANMSFTLGSSASGATCEGDYSIVCTSVSNSVNRGILLAASAGNVRRGQLQPPASVPGVMAIGGLQLNGGVALGFWDEGIVATSSTTSREVGSNWGPVVAGVPQIKLIAPAKDILSTFKRGVTYVDYARCGDKYGPPVDSSVGYGTCSGTSMSAPHVVAAAALVKSANPLLISEDVQSILTSTAAALGGEGMNRQGFGVPRVDAAVQASLDQGGGGKTNALNRVTPLFGFFAKPTTALFTTGPAPRAFDHFFSTIPQMGLSARIGTLQPAPQKLVVTPTGSGWVRTCSGQCDPTLPLNTVSLTGPISLRTNQGQTLNLYPVPGLPSPYAIKVTAYVNEYMDGPDLPDFPERVGYILPPFDADTLQTTLTIHSDVEWRIGASIEPIEFSASFDSWGKTISGYSNLTASPINPNIQAGDGSLANFDAKGIAGVLTTHLSPFANVPDSAIVPLYRLSWKCGDPGPSPAPSACSPTSPGYLINHVAHAYATTANALEQLKSQGFKLDGIEGHVIARSLGFAPPGTVKLCQRFNELTNDRVLYLETDSPQGCNATLPPFHADTFEGRLNNYLVNTEQTDGGFLGYAFADLTPRPLFKPTQNVPLSLANRVVSGGFETPVLGANQSVAEHETTMNWEFIGEAGVQRDAFASALSAPEGIQTAWLRNVGRIRTVVPLTPGTYTLSFRASLPNQNMRVSFAGRAIDTISPSSLFGLYSYPITVEESGEFPIVFEGLARQILHTDADPLAMAFLDDVKLKSTVNAAAACNLDVDGDNQVLANTDGAAILRVMQGMSTASVASHVLSPKATVSASDLPAAILAQAPWLDIDGNGKVDASTDGVLLLRSLLGFRGSAVTDGVLGANSERTTWDAIRTYLTTKCGTTNIPLAQ